MCGLFFNNLHIELIYFFNYIMKIDSKHPIDVYGRTVAMYAGMAGMLGDLSTEYDHDPSYVDNNGYTVALYAAECEQIHSLPKRWEHDPNMTLPSGDTVAMLVA